MNTKVRTIVALLVLALLIGLVAALWRPAATGLAQLWSPLPTPTQTPFYDFEPTPPSENWPTLTPWPTATPWSPGGDEPPPPGVPWPTPTGEYTPWPEPTLEPTPTRPPLLLTPIPPGPPPDDLQFLYYTVGSELRAIMMDRQGRRWSESSVAVDLDEPLGVLHLSPDGRYLAVGGWGMGGALYVVERSSGWIWCPMGERENCTGRFVDWTRDGQLLFEPDTSIPNPLNVVPGTVLVVDIATGQYSQLEFPTSPDEAYSYSRGVSLSPDDSRVVYALTYWRDGREISEIWTMQLDGMDRQLLREMEGVISTISWSPVGEQLMYLYRPGTLTDLDPYELWLMNSDGTDARLVASQIYESHHPTWSPDGRRVAFVQVDDPILFLSDWRGPGTNIYVVDMTTGAITRLSVFEGRSNRCPTWSPDGQFVAFVSSIITGDPEYWEQTPIYTEVWVASVDGSQLYALSGNADYWSTVLTWLPVGFSMQEE